MSDGSAYCCLTKDSDQQAKGSDVNFGSVSSSHVNKGYLFPWGYLIILQKRFLTPKLEYSNKFLGFCPSLTVQSEPTSVF